MTHTIIMLWLKTSASVLEVLTEVQYRLTSWKVTVRDICSLCQLLASNGAAMNCFFSIRQHSMQRCTPLPSHNAAQNCDLYFWGLSYAFFHSPGS